MKDKEHQKKTLPPPALAFLLHLAGNGDLAHLPIPETDGENPNRPVTFPFALLARPATGLIAANHAAQQGTGQDGGRVRHLLNKLFAGGGKLSDPFFHLYTMKDNTPTYTTTREKQQNINKMFVIMDCVPDRRRNLRPQ